MKNRKPKNHSESDDSANLNRKNEKFESAKHHAEKSFAKKTISRPSSSTSKTPKSKRENAKLIFIIALLFLTPILVSWIYNNKQANLVNKPLDEPSIINEDWYKSEANLDRYWGTYRPNLYFGLKTRHPNPLNVGLIWFNQLNPKGQIRHSCEQGDGLAKYGWTAHDGRNFGIQDIYESADNAFSIKTSWVKRICGSDGGDWTTRVKVQPNNAASTPNGAFVSMIFYIGTEYAGWIKSIKQQDQTTTVVSGETLDVGAFKIKLVATRPDSVYVNKAHGNVSLYLIKDELLRGGYFQRVKLETGDRNSNRFKEYYGLNSPEQSTTESNFVAFQVSGFLPFEFELLFESKSCETRANELKGANFDALLSSWHEKFTQKFERLFKLREKNFSSNAITMAESTLSNLLGGIGFFSGNQAIVQSYFSKEPVLYWQANLYSAVPSRSFFPRGFLWDEGFHNILIGRWDIEITKDIIGHWLDLMNQEGWIPREVILNDEARSKVPKEFWIQNNQYANPPTLFLALNMLASDLKDRSTTQNKNHEYLMRVYKRLNHWYDWFNKTQTGKVNFAYRWRGRVSDSLTELNAKTLTSGLDDYPRASHPNENERHLDLRCWMTLASKIMADFHDILFGANSDDKTTSNQYRTHYETLRNNELLNELHWSGSQYADYGLHTDHVKLVRQKPTDMRVDPNSMPMVRQVIKDPVYQYVNSVGYVSLFPFMLEIIDHKSEQLGQTLEQLRDIKHLWTDYGLRSLSKQAPLYNKRNTEHDPPYWRSAIWINMNYLTLKALKHYSSMPGPFQQKAGSIYTELRENIIKNIQKNYESTGYIWEQYTDLNGKGKGSHPFTGWSSLIVLIMAEIY